MYYYVAVLLICSLTRITNAEDIRKVQGCEGEKVVLKCPKGYIIDVKTALYGRKNPLICHIKSDKSVNDCAAGVALDIVKFKCDQKETCTVYASNHLFGDPCFETFKYLEVTYDCEKGEIRSKDACEGEELDIKCPDGTYLWISNAMYGRTNQQTCTGPKWNSRSNQCRAENALNVVESKCDNLRECQIRASNDIFGDPCHGTYKYLEVDYQCLTRSPDPMKRISTTTDSNSRTELPIAFRRDLSANETKSGTGNQITPEEHQTTEKTL